MRRAHRVCRTVTLRLRFGDFTRATRSHTLPEATAQTHTLLAAARDLLAAAMPLIRSQGITLIGVAFSSLEGDEAVQLGLQLDRRENKALDAALDELRDRFGSGSIKRAVLLGRDEGQSVPLLPD
jgi:DNA polymerase-4